MYERENDVKISDFLLTLTHTLHHSLAASLLSHCNLISFKLLRVVFILKVKWNFLMIFIQLDILYIECIMCLTAFSLVEYYWICFLLSK